MSFLDRAAEGSAKLIALDCVLLRREEVTRVEIAIAKVIECRSVNCIATRFRDDIDHRSAGPAVARIEIIGFDGELRERVRIGKCRVEVGDIVLVRRAIELIGDLVAHGAVDGDGLRFAGSGVGRGIGSFADNRAGGHEDQRCRIPALQREVLDVLLVDYLTQRSGLRIDHGGIGFHSNARGGGGDRKGQPESHGDVHVEFDSLLLQWGKARCGDFQIVNAGRYEAELESAL